jgi:hypothetical protein
MAATNDFGDLKALVGERRKEAGEQQCINSKSCKKRM